MKFSIKDRDDHSVDENCVKELEYSCWFNICLMVGLNGIDGSNKQLLVEILIGTKSLLKNVYKKGNTV